MRVVLILTFLHFAFGDQCTTGRRQSPVDVRDNMLTTVNSIKLELYNVNKTFDNITLVHNDDYGPNSAVLMFDYTYNKPFVAVTSSQPLTELNLHTDGKYYLKRARIYWGQSPTTGSNHAVNGRRYVGEMHWVFRWSSEVQDYQYEPSRKKRGASAKAEQIRLVTLLERGAANPDFKPVTDLSMRTTQYGSSASTDQPFNMANFMTSDVVAYRGSTLYGGCSESVAYFVLRKTIKVNGEQCLAGFRSWKDKNGATIMTNTRTIQPLNNRKLYTATNNRVQYTYGVAYDPSYADAEYGGTDNRQDSPKGLAPVVKDILLATPAETINTFDLFEPIVPFLPDDLQDTNYLTNVVGLVQSIVASDENFEEFVTSEEDKDTLAKKEYVTSYFAQPKAPAADNLRPNITLRGQQFAQMLDTIGDLTLIIKEAANRPFTHELVVPDEVKLFLGKASTTAQKFSQSAKLLVQVVKSDALFRTMLDTPAADALELDDVKKFFNSDAVPEEIRNSDENKITVLTRVQQLLRALLRLSRFMHPLELPSTTESSTEESTTSDS